MIVPTNIFIHCIDFYVDLQIDAGNLAFTGTGGLQGRSLTLSGGADVTGNLDIGNKRDELTVNFDIHPSIDVYTDV